MAMIALIFGGIYRVQTNDSGTYLIIIQPTKKCPEKNDLANAILITLGLIADLEKKLDYYS